MAIQNLIEVKSELENAMIELSHVEYHENEG